MRKLFATLGAAIAVVGAAATTRSTRSIEWTT